MVQPIKKVYSYVDTNPLDQVSYYRLKQVDYDGEFQFSDTIKVNVQLTNRLVLYPNSASDVLHIQTSEKIQGIQIHNFQGVIIYNVDEPLTTLGLYNFSDGFYFIHTLIDGEWSVSKFSVQR